MRADWAEDLGIRGEVAARALDPGNAAFSDIWQTRLERLDQAARFEWAKGFDSPADCANCTPPNDWARQFGMIGSPHFEIISNYGDDGGDRKPSYQCFLMLGERLPEMWQQLMVTREAIKRAEVDARRTTAERATQERAIPAKLKEAVARCSNQWVVDACAVDGATDEQRATCRSECEAVITSSVIATYEKAKESCKSAYVETNGKAPLTCVIDAPKEAAGAPIPADLQKALAAGNNFDELKAKCAASCKEEAPKALAEAQKLTHARARPQSKSERCQANCGVKGTICVSRCLDGDQDCGMKCVTERNACWSGCDGGSGAVQSSGSGPHRDASGSSTGLSCARSCAERTDACRSRCGDDLRCEAACADRGTKCTKQCE